MRRGVLVQVLMAVAVFAVINACTDGTTPSSGPSTSLSPVPPITGDATVRSVTDPSSAYCTAVFEYRRVRQRPTITMRVPAPRVEIEARLDELEQAFRAVVDTAPDERRREDFDALGDVLAVMDDALLDDWGTDGSELLRAADAWGGNIYVYPVREGFKVGTFSYSTSDYVEMWSDFVDAIGRDCDRPPEGWTPVHELPPAAVPQDLRFLVAGELGDELTVGASAPGRGLVRVGDGAQGFTNPVVAPDGRSFLVGGTDDGRPNSVHVGTFETFPTITQVSPPDESWSCPSWSPDGSAIAVTREVSAGRFVQSALDLATGEVVDLFPAAEPERDPPCGAYLDEDTLLVTALDPEHGRPSVWAQDVGSTDRAVVASMPACALIYPQVRPVSGEIAVIAGCDSEYDNGLWLVPAGGGAPQRVLYGQVAAPAWSPDGAWLLMGYTREPGEAPSVWIASADGSVASEVAPAWSSWPAWIPTEASCPACPA